MEQAAAPSSADDVSSWQSDEFETFLRKDHHVNDEVSSWQSDEFEAFLRKDDNEPRIFPRHQYQHQRQQIRQQSPQEEEDEAVQKEVQEAFVSVQEEDDREEAAFAIIYVT